MITPLASNYNYYLSLVYGKKEWTVGSNKHIKDPTLNIESLTL